MSGHEETRAILPERLFTVTELAEYLRVERQTVYRLPIPYVLVGRRRRYRPDDINSYLTRG